MGNGSSHDHEKQKERFEGTSYLSEKKAGKTPPKSEATREELPNDDATADVAGEKKA